MFFFNFLQSGDLVFRSYQAKLGIFCFVKKWLYSRIMREISYHFRMSLNIPRKFDSLYIQ